MQEGTHSLQNQQHLMRRRPHSKQERLDLYRERKHLMQFDLHSVPPNDII